MIFLFLSTFFLIIFLIQIYRRLISRSKLILIEGLDCSGKKTLANLIIQSAQNSSIRLNIGLLLKSPITSMADKFTYNWALSDHMRSFLYGLSHILDTLFYIPPRNGVVLQISYLPRHIGYNKINNYRVLNLIHRIFSPFRIKFNQIVYLFAEYETRQIRHKLQYSKDKEIQTLEDRFFLKNPNKYFEWEKITSKNCYEMNKVVFSIDTTVKKPNEVFNEIISQGFVL